MTELGRSRRIFQTAAVAGLSWKLALLLPGSIYPVFAPLAAILTTQVTLADSIQKGLYRILGVIVGVGVGGLFGHFFSVTAISITAAIFIGLSAAKLLDLNEQVVSQVGVSTLLVLEYGHMHGYMIERICETMIGAAVAVLINLLTSSPKSALTVKQEIFKSTQEMTCLLQHLAAEAGKENTAQIPLQARSLVAQLETDRRNVEIMIGHFRYTPFWRKERLEMEELAGILRRMTHMAGQIRGIARSLLDIQLAAKPLQNFSEILLAAANCISLFGEVMIDPSEKTASQLKQAIGEARGIPERFFVKQQASMYFVPEYGGIFTDIGRILDEVENRFPEQLTYRFDSDQHTVTTG